MAQTQGQVLAAYSAILGMGKRVTGAVAFSLFRVKQQLKPLIEFQTEEEMKLIQKYGGELDESGQISFKKPENKAKFLKERSEFSRMEIKPPLEPVKVDPAAIPDINMEEIEALNGFIEFE